MSEDQKEEVVQKKSRKSESPSIEEQLEQLKLENAITEAELKKLELEERKYSIKDLKSRIEGRELKEMQIQNDRASQGRTFAQDEATDAYKWKICTHRKGGLVSQRDMRALTTGGNEDQYAVIKHQMINGDIWVRCLRCGRTWSPPVEEKFYFRGGKVVAPKDGVLDSAAFDKAQIEYQIAVAFPTRNSMSGSVQCRFTTFNMETKRHEDAADVYRRNLKDSTLR